MILTSYEDALAEQLRRSGMGRTGWLLFCCPPTITIGARGHFSDVLMPYDELRRRGVRVLPVDRGGQVTYHGPEQIIGFPFGRLEQFTGDSRGVRKFLSRLKAGLTRFIAREIEGDWQLDECTEAAGVWLRAPSGERRKIVSIGMGFGREGMRHGFALNVSPADEGFGLVNACGEIGARPASLLSSAVEPEHLEGIKARLEEALRMGDI